jgi:EAL domain-containing protein (putative c-di-GMP-specific phosphodiesterase class I)
LKIDRSFVKELIKRPETRAMVRSLMTLAHDLGMRVIAEGIETPEQLNLIKDMGGNEAQGYLLGRPTPDPVALLRCASPKSSPGAGSLVLCMKGPRNE